MDTFLNWMDQKMEGIELPEEVIECPKMNNGDVFIFQGGRDIHRVVIRSVDFWIDLDQEDPEYQKPIQHLYF